MGWWDGEMVGWWDGGMADKHSTVASLATGTTTQDDGGMVGMVGWWDDGMMGWRTNKRMLTGYKDNHTR